MVKIAGGIMIVSGCLGLGLWYRQQFIHRLQTLRILDGILEMFMSEIRYGKSTLPECCRRLSERMENPYGACFSRIYRQMLENTGDSFGEVFRHHMEDCLMRLPLKSGDRDNFLHFTQGDSFAEGQMQLRAIEQSRELLRSTIEELERENGEKCKVAVGLGAMSGLLLILVLL